ncbi:MAG: hypothetical protein KDD52_06510 [Bdellovibrionales bacterium]|nr:hypothetical protein [Bdellovibrionales bacterium]
MKKYRNIFIFLSTLFFISSSHAAGYLEYNESTKQPYAWDTSGALTCNRDQGGLGSVNNTAVNGYVDSALSSWANATASSPMSFSMCSTTAQDIDAATSGSNLAASHYLNFVDFNAGSCVTPDFLYVYDEDGSIFQDLFGSVVSNTAGILGFASPLRFSGNEITCGVVFLNGALFQMGADPDLSGTPETISSVATHELGHMLNFTHSQINSDIFSAAANAAQHQYVPTMYFAVSQTTGDSQLSLELDDQYAFMKLYDSTALNAAGKISGSVTRRLGEGVLGVNVLCRDIANPDQNVVSYPSGQDLDGEGEFICGGLPAGSYEVEIEPIQHAINDFDPFPPLIPGEKYNDDESFDPDLDSLSASTPVTVSLGNTTSDIDVVINENGRLQSGPAVERSIVGQIPDYASFLSMPSGATKATISLVSQNLSADLDLYIKKGPEFSIASNVDSIPVQADYSATSTSGEEEIVIDGSSDPKIDADEFQILVVKFSPSGSVSYDLQVTLEGSASLIMPNYAKNKTASNGQKIVSTGSLIASGDSFVIEGISYVDEGKESLSGVTSAYLYEDVDNNGSYSATDRLIAQTTQISQTEKSIEFTGFREEVSDGDRMNILITYDVTSTAQIDWLSLSCLLFLGFVSLLLKKYTPMRRYFLMSITLAFCSTMLSCSKGGDQDYDPRVLDKASVDARALGFGNDFTVQDGRVENVKDFFRF